MDFDSLVQEKYKRPNLGAAHLDPRDAYKDVPILKRPTWHNEIAAYFFFGGISAGSAVIGSLAEVFGGEERRQLAHTAHYVSFATLLPCPPLLIDDLGMPSRFHHMMRIFKPSSPMNLGSWALLVHGAGATVTVLTMLAHEGKLPAIRGLLRLLPERLLAGLGLPSSFTLAGYTGVLLGTTSIPVWHTSQLLGALFMASSLSTGAAAISLAGTFAKRENESDHRALASLGVVLGTAEMALLGGYVATTGEAAKPLLHGREGALLAGAATLMAAAVALDVASLVVGRPSRFVGVAASAAALAAGAMLRWAVVRAGQGSAADREGTLRAMKRTASRPGWGSSEY